jgi:hypothetical protein
VIPRARATHPILETPSTLGLHQLLGRLGLLEMSLLREMPLAVRDDSSHVLFVLLGVLGRVLRVLVRDSLLVIGQTGRGGPTLLGLRWRISTIFLPDSWPTDSPEPSDLDHPVDSEPSVLRNASSSCKTSSQLCSRVCVRVSRC